MLATIKICGLKDDIAIQTAIDCGAKYLGFVCNYLKSPRNLSPGQLINTISKIKNSNTFKVAVMVNPEDKIIDSIQSTINFLQLHGSENNERIIEIKKKI